MLRKSFIGGGETSHTAGTLCDIRAAIIIPPAEEPAPEALSQKTAGELSLRRRPRRPAVNPPELVCVVSPAARP
jgi:hypothetical protein